MNVIYLIDGKPHRQCECDANSPVCLRGSKRACQTAGYGYCLIPAPDAVIVGAVSERGACPDPMRHDSKHCEKIELMQRDMTLERCAEICESQIPRDVGHGRLQARSILSRAATSIRALKTRHEQSERPDSSK